MKQHVNTESKKDVVQTDIFGFKQRDFIQTKKHFFEWEIAETSKYLGG